MMMMMMIWRGWCWWIDNCNFQSYLSNGVDCHHPAKNLQQVLILQQNKSSPFKKQILTLKKTNPHTSKKQILLLKKNKSSSLKKRILFPILQKTNSNPSKKILILKKNKSSSWSEWRNHNLNQFQAPAHRYQVPQVLNQGLSCQCTIYGQEQWARLIHLG